MKKAPWSCFGATLLIIIFLLAGCKTTAINTLAGSSRQSPLAIDLRSGNSIVTVFLNLRKPDGPYMNVQLAGVEIGGGGSWVTLSDESRGLDTKVIGDGQSFIARNALPSGSYEQLRLTFTSASLIKNGTFASLSIPEQQVELRFPSIMRLERGESSSLFITWDVDESVDRVILFRPKMTVALQTVHILNNLLFVACPEIDTVYLVRADTNRVEASVGISGRPSYLGLDPQNNRLYVLAPEESAIKVVDLSTIRVVDKIFVSLDHEPNFMTLSEDRLTAYILDSKGNTVVSIDLTTGNAEQRATVNYNPEYALYLNDEGKLAVVLSRSNAVLLLNPISLETRNSIPTGNSPAGLVSSQGMLYVAETRNNSVLAYDLKAQEQQSGQIIVGFDPRRLVTIKNQIYVANAASGSISIIAPQIRQTIREIPVADNVGELAVSETYNWLYVGSEKAGGIAVIDLDSGRVGGFIDLAASPAGMQVLELNR